ncbi:MAG: PilZ domain-containing protein [Myxococcota bacterium]
MATREQDATTTTAPATKAAVRVGIRRAVAMTCELVTSSRDTPLRHRVRDVSISGLWADTPDGVVDIRPGDVVVVCFCPGVRGRREWIVFADVARVDPASGLGLRFLDLTTDERFALGVWLRGRREARPRGSVELGPEGPALRALRVGAA